MKIGDKVRTNIVSPDDYAKGAVACLTDKTGIIEEVREAPLSGTGLSNRTQILVVFDEPAKTWWKAQTPPKAWWFLPSELVLIATVMLIAELEPAADALREGNLEAALEVLAEVRPDEVASFSTKFLSGAINAHARVSVESVLFDHGVHWNGPVEPTSALIDELIAAVRSAAKSALG